MALVLNVPTLKDWDATKSPEDNWREMRRILDEYFRNVTVRANACWPKDGSEPAKLVSSTLPAGTTAFIGRTRSDTYNAYHDGTAWYSWDEDRASWRTVVGLDSDQYRIERAAASSGTLSWTTLTLLNALGVPRCRAYRTSNLTLPNVSWTTVPMDSEQDDTDSMHSTSSNTDRLTINTAGTYLVGALAEHNSDPTAHRAALRIRLSGATTVAEAWNYLPSGEQWIASLETLYPCTLASYFTLEAYQNTGGNKTLNYGAGYSPVLWAVYVGS